MDTIDPGSSRQSRDDGLPACLELASVVAQAVARCPWQIPCKSACHTAACRSSRAEARSAFVHDQTWSVVMRAAKYLCPLFAFFAALCVAAPPISAQQASQVAPYNAFYTFGDSLADNGNDFIVTQALGFNPAVPPSTSPHRAYFNGRFSNGPVAFEYLWQRLTGRAPGSKDGLVPVLNFPFTARSKAINFAFGGSGTGFFDGTPGGFSIPGL
jgi:hypothetical protein